MMHKRINQLALRFLTIAVFTLPNPAMAQSSDPAWLDDLQLELATDHECKVAEYLGINEGKIGGRNMYFAKVKCVDGREFDATRVEPEETFSIRECEVISC